MDGVDLGLVCFRGDESVPVSSTEMVSFLLRPRGAASSLVELDRAVALEVPEGEDVVDVDRVVVFALTVEEDGSMVYSRSSLFLVSESF